MKKEDIINEITKYVNCGKYSSWYVGITNNAGRRLFNENEHNVDKEHGRWITCPANSKKDAQDIEEYFLGQGMDGDTGGGNDESTFVYCYMKTSTTNP